ncbi:DUF5681 domain-containing protein (plasmid) [Pararoseomonas sp. SCSIO 73927]|uniref:DUF5681 domain-containing protein n=1 Tax=Pararoseomonas sp. SCSIO 73927 TaxID=3114537 RepID=UPI0030CC0935
MADDPTPEPEGSPAPRANAGSGRGQDGRWQPGASGNPRGTPTGSRPRSAMELDELARDAAGGLVIAMARAALAGDVAAAEVILRRVWPVPRGRAVQVPGLAGVPTQNALDAVILQVAEGALPIETAEGIARLLQTRATLVEVEDLKREVEALKASAGPADGAAP